MSRLSAPLVRLRRYLCGTRLSDSGGLRVAALIAFLLANSAMIEAQTVSLTATWNASSESDIAGYVLFSGTQTGIYSSSIDVGNVTSWQGVFSSGTRYYFAVQAYNTSSNFSPYSTEVFVDVPPGPPSLTSLTRPRGRWAQP
jgi:hypothetical protein